jgi:hypothetical protein
MTLGVEYPSKKVLKASIGKPLNYVETSLFGAQYKDDGKLVVVNSPYVKRNWFATVTMEKGLIKKVE